MVHTVFRALSVMLILWAGCDSDDAGRPPHRAPAVQSTAHGGDKDAAPKADPAPADAAEAGEGSAAARPTDAAPAHDAKDAAFFVVRDKGIVALTGAGFQVVPGTERGFAAKFVHGADGELYARTSRDIVRVRTDGLPSAAPLGYDEVGSVAGFDVGPKGEVWTIGSKGVSEYRDGAWRTETKAAVGLGKDFAVGIALDSAGQPWAATSGSLVRRKAGTWEAAKLPSGRTELLSQLGRGADGEVYISTYDRLFRLTSTPGRVKVLKASYDSPGAFSFAQSTFGVAVSGLQSASIFLPKGKARRFSGKRDLRVGDISAVTADAQGRVWAAGDGGIAIAGPGDARVTWRSGSVEEVAGQVSALVVRGQGPPLPEAGAVKKGGIRGRIVKGEGGVAGVKVELCESPSLIYSRTPCTGAPTHLRGKTDADGNFAFDDVPLGAYGIAVKQGRKWQITVGAALGTKMSEAEVYDIGSVELK